jgi:Na+-transporting NADH:ubiquinone oxidoreductase subunit B
MGLRRALDRLGRAFGKDGRFARLGPVYEMVDTLLYTPGNVARGASHVRDALDLKRMMFVVVVALMPCVVMALFNTGYQAHLLIEAGGAPLPGWRSALFAALGLAHSSRDVLACFIYGALHFVPALLVCFAAGGAAEIVFAIVRRHSVNEGFFVTGFLIPLTLPPTIPLWQIAIGTAFGVVVAKEIFGGTGMNFLNPALVVRALLFFAYPVQMSGEVWVAASGVDGNSGATWLSELARGMGGLDGASGATQVGELAGEAAMSSGTDWWSAFWGLVPGSMGETSVACCLLGLALLLYTRIAAWQTIVGVVVGTLAAALLLNTIGSTTNPMFAVPFHWHVAAGGWAFGTVFMATDPVSSAFTLRGKLFYGFGIGVLVILIRVVNPAYPEGTMLAILFMNMFAPVIDHFEVRANIKRRAARYAR